MQATKKTTKSRNYRQTTPIEAAKSEKRGFAQAVFATTKTTVSEFIDDNCMTIAGAVAYSALQGIISLILGFIAVGSFFLQDPIARANFTLAVSSIIPAELNNTGVLDLTGIIKVFTNNAGAVSFISIVALLWTGSGVFGQVKYALNVAFDVARDERHILVQISLQLVMLVVMGVLLVAAFSINILSGLFFNLKLSVFGISPYNFSFLLPILLTLLPPILETLVFALLFKFSPARRGIRWKPVLLAAIVTAGLFELLKQLFALYLNLFGVTDSTAKTFGALGGIFIFLFFLYLSSVVILLGGELAAVLHNIKSGLALAKTPEATVETKAEEIDGEFVPPKAANKLKESGLADES